MAVTMLSLQQRAAEVSLKQVMVASDSRFHTLSALDANEPLRAELAASGVPQHTIAALYPPSFVDVIEGLKSLITEASLVHITDFLTLEPATNAGLRLRKQLAGEALELIEAPRSDEVHQATLTSLSAHIGDCMVGMPLGTARMTLARTGAVMLQQSYMLMANLELCAGARVDVRKFFCRVTEKLLPQLP